MKKMTDLIKNLDKVLKIRQDVRPGLVAGQNTPFYHLCNTSFYIHYVCFCFAVHSIEPDSVVRAKCLSSNASPYFLHVSAFEK